MDGELINVVGSLFNREVITDEIKYIRPVPNF